MAAPPRIRQRWNDGWSYRRRVSVFQELGGQGREWQAVTLPHDALWETGRDADAPGGEASGYFRGGAFEYRKTFFPDIADAGSRILLEFGGVYRDSAVFVNGALAGQWPYGYSRFAVRLDPFLRFGEENEVRVECRTYLDSRWYAGAGIHRDVYLVTKPPVHLAHDGVTVTTPDVDDELAIVEVAVDAENASSVTATPRVSVALVGPDGATAATGSAPVTLRPGDRGTARLRLPVEAPVRWSIDSPALYAAGVALYEDAGDEATEFDAEDVTFGIRTLQVDARRGMRINGEPVTLRGACIHADAGPLGAAAIARADERRVELLKKSGFNAVRMSHHPASPALLDACDRLGMLVADETFDMWTTGKTDFDASSAFPEWWERDVEAMVAKDRNHPSVVMYSIGNEIPELGIPEGGRWSRLLAEKVRALDPTRLVTNGVNGFVAAIDMVLAGMARQREQAADAPAGGGVNGLMTQVADMMNTISVAAEVTDRTEEAFAVLDVAGLNYGDGRYESDASLFPHRVLLGTETFPPRIAHNWELVAKHPHVIGDFTWTGWDYLGEAGIGAVSYSGPEGGGPDPSVSQAFPWLTAWSGDHDITGVRRPVSFYREIVFGLRTDPYIAVRRAEHHGQQQVRTPWAWSDAVASWSWPGFEGEPVTVEVYANADEVELLLDGAPIGRAPVGEELPFLATAEVTYRPGELVAVARRAGHETGRSALHTPGEALALDLAADRGSIRADTTDLAYVAVTLTDGRGGRHTGRDRAVSVTVEGAGELRALGTGRPATEEGFTGPSVTTFDGRALAIVRPTGAGDITVTASAEGCTPEAVRITAS